MNKYMLLTILFGLSLLAGSAYAIDVYTINGEAHYQSLDKLRKMPQESFTTKRFKHDQNLVENWQGVSLQKWLKDSGYSEFQSIRFESEDNYMVRIHKAELDSMPGYLVLVKDSKTLDSTEVRLIFPKQRDMFWVRGIARIYLEDFKPVPPPAQIFVWEAETSKIKLVNEPAPFVNIKGYLTDEIMPLLMHADAGSVILVSRDGLKMRLEYPKHLKGSVLELTSEGNLNLKSPVIPAGMWLKDIVFMQCGPYALIRHDFLYRLPSLYTTLQWGQPEQAQNVIRAKVAKKTVSLESLSTPEAEPFLPGDWLELP